MDYLLDPPSYLLIRCLNDRDLVYSSKRNLLEIGEALETNNEFDLSVPIEVPMPVVKVPQCVTITIDFLYLDRDLYRKIETFINHNNDGKSIIEKPFVQEVVVITGIKEKYKKKYEKAKRKYDRKIRRICKYVSKLDNLGFKIYKELPVFDPNPKWLEFEKVVETKYTTINLTCSVGDELYNIFLREGLLAKLINEVS